VKFQIIAGELCLDFINTLDNRPVPERRQELVQSYSALLDWAVQAGALSPARRRVLESEAESRPKDAEAVRAKAVELRECLYRMVTAIARNRRASEDDRRTFNAFLGEALSHLELRPARKGFRLELQGDPPRLDSVLWPIVRSASDLLTGDDLKYIRECADDTCRWMFVDRSKNHSRRWCNMKVCGNRIKARKFYRRQAAIRNVG
jgi:predicted RNA-binding Zn ribbon-like protein